MLAQRRPSISLSISLEEVYEEFIQADIDVFKEDQGMESVLPIIKGKITNAKCGAGRVPFTNLNHLVDSKLVPGNSDLYYGARPEQLNRKIRDELSSQIIPSTQVDLPIVPNFFLAAKGPDGFISVAGRQACYDGALGARGIHSLQSYGQDEPTYDNNAYTILSIYHGGTLKIYTSHLAQPNGPGSRPEYYMNQLDTFAMTGNANSFRQGLTAFRNARDWAKEQRDKAISQVNERVNAKSQSQESPPQIEAPQTSEASYQESEISVDELAIDVNPPADELAIDVNPPAKRSSTSQQSGHRKRSTGGATASARQSSKATETEQDKQ